MLSETEGVPKRVGQFSRARVSAFHGAGSGSKIAAPSRLRPVPKWKTPMPSPAIDLKLRLTLRVAAISALCGFAAAAYALVDADRTARAKADWTAEVVAKDLALQQDQLHWIKGGPDGFPDLQRVAAALAGPGVCVGYRTPSGEIAQRLCSGFAPSDVGAPEMFASLYQRLFNLSFESARPVVFRGKPQGEAVASIDPQVVLERSWSEAGGLLVVMSCALLALCVLTYAALASALRPTRLIRAGLARLAAGDLSARLPPFDLGELSSVANVFNQLAATLETTLVERNELTKRLIRVQDAERQHLARELHDEFGQSLAAIGAMAVSAGHTAARECPALLPECQSVARAAADMMEALRGALLRLRPPDIEELGLAASLQGLIAGWNKSSGGRTRFSIDLAGEFESLPEDFAASLYRIVQEAITNAAKHAQASRVMIRLCMQNFANADQRGLVELSVADDGRAGAERSSLKPGLGLLGMRERVAALRGQLVLETLRPSGLMIQARIPLPPFSSGPGQMRKAA
jgi:signal transduction histidine kinase